jgi:hypothetical protein
MVKKYCIILSLLLSWGLTHSQNQTVVISEVSVPSDFPHFRASVNTGNTAPGRIFLNNWGGRPYILILENDGTPYYYRRVAQRSRDFKVQPNGLLTRFMPEENAFALLNTELKEIDTLRAAHGLAVDEHELSMQADGSYLLIALDYRQVDMSELVSGGNANATVVDNLIHYFNAEKELIFAWNSRDYFAITDAEHENLRNSFIDYVHMNSIAIDYDGHIIISSRHLSEITKIDSQTGAIIWRLGGRHNQFSFAADEPGPSYQHHARPVPGKANHYTLFDNGNYHTPQYSRAVEYKLDTLAMTATVVWQYDHDKQRYTWWMGNAQRLANGNTLINWADASLPKVTEVDTSGNVVYEGDFTTAANCYRAFRFDFSSPQAEPYLLAEAFPDHVSLIFNQFGHNDITDYIIFSASQGQALQAIDTVQSSKVALSDLQSGNAYDFAVRAVFADATVGALSNLVTITPQFIPPGSNYIDNGDFSQGDRSWETYKHENGDGLWDFANDLAVAVIRDGGDELWHLQLMQTDIPLIKGREYKLSFTAYADAERPFWPRLERNGSPFENYGQINDFILKRTWQSYEHVFTMQNETDYRARLTFNVGLYDANVYIDDVKLEEIEVTAIPVAAEAQTFRLGQNYPNPFNGQTSIPFYLTRTSKISLRIYNASGQLVRQLRRDIFAAGQHQISFSAENLSSGVYFYRLVSQNGQITRKMLLLK